MIAVERESGSLKLTIPTNGLSAQEVDDLALWMRTKAEDRLRKSPDQVAWELSEQVKADWWRENGPEILKRIGVHEAEGGR